jgi:YVTN family beta-propeller protein
MTHNQLPTLLIPVLVAGLCMVACSPDNGSSDSSETTAGSTVTPTSPRTSADEISFDGPLNSLVVADDGVWVGSTAGISRVDPKTSRITVQFDVPNEAGYFAIGFGSVWVVDYHDSVVRRIDPITGEEQAEIETGLNPEGVAITAKAVWVASHHDGTVTRVDPSTNEAIATVRVGRAGAGGPQHLVASAETVWAGVPNRGSVVGIDAESNEVEVVIETQSGACGELTLEGNHLWVGGCVNSASLIDVTTNKEAGQVDLDEPVGQAFAYAGGVWMTVLAAPGEPGRLVRINPRSLQIEDTLALDASAWSAAPRFGSLWVTFEDAGVLQRIPLADLAFP